MNPHGKNVATSNVALPSGWVFINRDFLSGFREEPLTSEEAVAYFDGLSPTWKEALSNRIPHREIVHTVLNSLDEARRVKRRQVTLLFGAGGEGKSTVLRQVVSALSESNSYQNILWHEDPLTPLDKSFINELVSSRETWLLVSDEADQIAGDIFDAVCLLREKSKNNVQFLLCCRDTDWKAKHADELNWNEKVLLEIKTIRGLTPEDASLIVQAWGYYGNRGLGKLAGLDMFEASSQLVEKAKSEAQNNKAEGSFLGAMLRVRFGEAIQEHVKSLLTRLNNRQVPGGSLTLMDAFASIVALHADNILLLSKSVLARSLNCSVEVLQRHVIHPLGEEAAVTTHADYVLTRHRAIAEAAKSLLASTFGIDFSGIYINLLRSSMKAYFDGDLEVDATYWNQLPTTFFDRGEKKLAFRLAKALIEIEPNNPFHVVGLSKLYRRDRQSDKAVKVFREAFERVEPDRAFYHEWSTAEGYNNTHLLSVWLDGISLADGVKEKKRDRNRLPVSLSGLATSFGKLFERANPERRFIEACAAAAKLGLQSHPDDITRDKLLQNKTKSEQAGVGDMTNVEAFDKLIAGINLAWERRDTDGNLPASVEPAHQLTFKELDRQFGI